MSSFLHPSLRDNLVRVDKFYFCVHSFLYRFLNSELIVHQFYCVIFEVFSIKLEHNYRFQLVCRGSLEILFVMMG